MSRIFTRLSNNFSSSSSYPFVPALSHSCLFGARISSTVAANRFAERRPASTSTTTSPSPLQARATHSAIMEELTSSLKSLGVSEVPSVHGIISYPTYNQVDIFRSHIADQLAPITGVDGKIIYNAIQWTQTLDNGDLMLAVPALRIKGKKPDELAKEIAEKVCPEVLGGLRVTAQLPNFLRHKRWELTVCPAVPRVLSYPKTQRRQDLPPLLLQACGRCPARPT